MPSSEGRSHQWNAKIWIHNTTLDNNQTSVQVDNAHLAADDFRVKYESERCMSQSVDADISGLRKVLDDLTLDKSSLESEIESLTEELAYLKKNHDEEMKGLQGVQGDVTVQMDAAPGINILKNLNDIRAQYEDMADENRRKAEEEYTHKVSELNKQISHSSEQAEASRRELTELKRTCQTLEIELQTQLAMKCSLENALADTEHQYGTQLAMMQERISILEEQLCQLRNEMETQSREYNLLLDIRTKLEAEIEMYHKLLEEEGGSSHGNGSSSSSSSSSSQRGGRTVQDGHSSDSSSANDAKKSRLVTTITEDRVDGRLVSTRVDKVAKKA
ncbi:keratin, type I cytoskeletal 24-like isoform X2 [Hyperolius riggenbachi]|uniref:keratin, type I cytoskeletal 24-like isoform X2 n=1 Tax=Hyperolius riggenbachi TaxID=752182 RepID=UPI0035A3C787